MEFVFCLAKRSEIASLKNEIVGTWEFEKFVGFGSYSLPPNNGRIIVFASDRSYERRQFDTILFQGSYVLQERDDCYERNTNNVLYTSESGLNDYKYIEREQDKLLLSTPNCYPDGGTAYYRRIK